MMKHAKTLLGIIPMWATMGQELEKEWESTQRSIIISLLNERMMNKVQFGKGKRKEIFGHKMM